MRVLVLGGGNSDERDVSLRSAANVANQVSRLGYELVQADPADADFDLAKLTHDRVVVLPMLHGVGGEDGTLQKQLEVLGVPFLGSGSAASELTFDKHRYREFVLGQGILMAAGKIVDRQSFELSPLKAEPYVLKPVDGGSSVDTLILHDLANEPKAAYFDALFSRHPEMLLEHLIVGHELTVGVLGDQALPIILIVPPQGEEFDYENKYNGRTQEIVDPIEISPDVQQRAKDLALQLHRITGCRHLSRSDMIVTASGDLYVLETNTIPGLTEQSLLPKMAAAAGIDMPALIDKFIEMAQQ